MEATYIARACNDPEILSRSVPRTAPGLVLAAGFDLGTRTGYAYTHVAPGQAFEPKVRPLYAGQFDLSAGPYESGAIRFVRLRRMLEALSPTVVFYEEPKFTPDQSAYRGGAAALLARALPSAEFLGGLKATLCAWCEERAVPCFAYGVGSIKKFAANKGNANKTEMIAAANEMTGLAIDPTNYESTGADNVADAVAVLLLGLSEHARGLS
jgi:hypothetical protein